MNPETPDENTSIKCVFKYQADGKACIEVECLTDGKPNDTIAIQGDGWSKEDNVFTSPYWLYKGEEIVFDYWSGGCSGSGELRLGAVKVNYPFESRYQPWKVSVRDIDMHTENGMGFYIFFNNGSESKYGRTSENAGWNGNWPGVQMEDKGDGLYELEYKIPTDLRNYWEDESIKDDVSYIFNNMNNNKQTKNISWHDMPLDMGYTYNIIADTMTYGAIKSVNSNKFNIPLVDVSYYPEWLQKLIEVNVPVATPVAPVPVSLSAPVAVEVASVNTSADEEEKPTKKRKSKKDDPVATE